MLASTALDRLGFDAAFAAAFAPHAAEGLCPARVSSDFGGSYRVLSADADLAAELPGRLRQDARSRAERPAVGDWVAVRVIAAEGKAHILAVLPRRSRFLRGAAGEGSDDQVVAANVDTVFIVSDLARDFNVRRLERYLLLTRESGAAPVIVLNKADLAAEIASFVAAVAKIAPGVPVHAISSRHGGGVEALLPYLAPGVTVALLGSSGVGKSTLVNRLLGVATQRTGEVRSSDGRGRHTTSSRQLLALPGGALVIDTPGMRELQLPDLPENLGSVFQDVEALAGTCRFRDCSHNGEPGCAVEPALPADRLASYRKFKAELGATAARRDPRVLRETKERVRNQKQARKSKHAQARPPKRNATTGRT